jgi:aconitate hydratase
MNFMNKSQLLTKNKTYNFFSIKNICNEFNLDITNTPYSLKILIENLCRTYDNQNTLREHLTAIVKSVKDPQYRVEIAFSPSRVLMQDFTGVPAVVDLATMRDAVKKMNKDPKKINPLVPVDLVIDHSVQVDYSGSASSYQKNVDLEYERNFERYQFLKWAKESFNNFRVVPPGTGICHQVNLENLAQVVWSNEQQNMVYFDTVVGTDSHTTMVNGLGVLGWGVGGIEAEAAMLGQPISMLIPEVIGFKLTGKLRQGITATDLVLTITQILRKKGVVGKFVEFFGEGLASLSLANRATIANMAPEYGATCGIFPIDQITLDYLYLTARSQENIDLVKAFSEAQGVYCDDYNNQNEYGEIIELNLSDVIPCLAGPKRPQDKVVLSKVSESLTNLQNELKINNQNRFSLEKFSTDIGDGDIVISAITSCTNTSNPAVLIGAGLLAKKAVELGLKINPRIKTSLAPGSQVVAEYLQKSGLQNYLDQLGFNIVGFGCTTCIGNSGPLDLTIEEVIKNNNLMVASVLSGNRNFEGRIHPLVKANYLASPPLVIAYALAGTMKIDIEKEPIATDKNGNKVYLSDIWPSSQEIENIEKQFITREVFAKKYHNLFEGDSSWQKISITKSDTYNWNSSSTYIRLPNYFDNLHIQEIKPIINAKILAIFGDSITTDHISPAGNISLNSPAGAYLLSKGVEKKDFNSYGARRGNHEVMIRGTFANVRIKNQMLGGVKEGGFTKDINQQIVSIYDASISFQNKHPLVVFAGKEYGTGSSRDWAAKGTMLLGIKAVIAESFERIHRSNLVGMGVMPLIFKNNQNWQSLNLRGDEQVDILNLNNNISPKQNIDCIITKSDGTKINLELICGLDTINEVEYYKNGGILQFVINQIIK